MIPELPDNFIAIVAPFPGEDRFLDGWMSRIRTIELALINQERVYLDFQDGYPADVEPEIVTRGSNLIAYRLNPHGEAHARLAEEVLGKARFVYAHTMHQAEYVLPYFDGDRMIIDIHGVVPEEELMMGSPERSEKFGAIEKEIFHKLKRAFVVTNSMAEHYRKKYPDCTPELIHLPVYDFDAATSTRNRLDEIYSKRFNVGKDHAVYAGGAQIWQCVDQMLDLMEENAHHNSYSIYSHNEEIFIDLIKSRNLPTELFQGYTSKEALNGIYDASNFGFVLRQESVVNRVASPTKICDYCAAAVIPIVDFSHIGDFEDYGYAYITAQDYREGYIPDQQTQRWMAEQNLSCMTQMENEFSNGIQRLAEMVAG